MSTRKRFKSRVRSSACRNLLFHGATALLVAPFMSRLLCSAPFAGCASPWGSLQRTASRQRRRGTAPHSTASTAQSLDNNDDDARTREQRSPPAA